MAKKTVVVSVVPSGPKPRPVPAPRDSGEWACEQMYDYLRPDCTGSAYGARIDANLRARDRWGYPEELDPEGEDYY